MTRPTDKLDEVLRFYCGQLGLPELYRTNGHGYEVAMVGLPGDKYHLEFSSYVGGSPGHAPSLENLLVFYFAAEEQMFDVVRRLGEAGHEPVSGVVPFRDLRNGSTGRPVGPPTRCYRADIA